MNVRSIVAGVVLFTSSACATHTHTQFEAQCQTQEEEREVRSCMARLSRSAPVEFETDELQARCEKQVCPEHRRTCSWSVTRWMSCSEWERAE